MLEWVVRDLHTDDKCVSFRIAVIRATEQQHGATSPEFHAHVSAPAHSGERGFVGIRRRDLGTCALAANGAGNMNDLSRLDGSNRPPQFGEERSIERDLVALRMKNHDSK